MSGYALSRFKSRDGMRRLTLYAWRPDAEPIGVIQILHGMREHMGRYDDFARFCVMQGFAVYGHDHAGHGRTGSESQDGHGYFGNRDGGKKLLDDSAAAGKIIARRHSGVPLYLLGHSMGSFLGRLLVVRTPGVYAGFICMGTGGARKAAPFARLFLEMTARTTGEKRTWGTLNRLIVSPAHMRSRGEKDMDWLSRDTAVGRAFSEDSMTKPLFSNRALCDLVSLQMGATSRKWAGMVGKALPVLLISGDNDIVGGNGQGVIQTYERLRLAGCIDVQVRLYEEARHELLNEINREEVYYDICTWIKAHLTA